jgi:dTDP-4-amino-4,6-dideoxygalactose transaminase
VEVENPDDCLSHVWHLFVIRTNNRAALQTYLEQAQIQTVIHYPIPPHKQKAYEELNHLSYPLTEAIHQEVLSLPISPVFTDENTSQLIDIINLFNN